MTKYQFADTDLAAKRLKYLADVYAATTREFIAGTVNSKPQLVLDLGCGPGYTTHLLAKVTKSDRVIGLDSSESFISRAKAGETDWIKFQLHDVSKVPFPFAPADMLYCRYLLSHLQRALKIVDLFITQLVPGGRLLIEESEHIKTNNKTFVEYLEIVTAMLADQSCKLFIGAEVAQARAKGYTVGHNEVCRFPIANSKMATMFYMNIQLWKHQPFIKNNYSEKTIDVLETKLAELSKTSDAGAVEMSLRQMEFVRA